MKLKDYLKMKHANQAEFAKQLGITQGHLNHIITGKRKPSVKLSKVISIATNNNVSKHELRPDIWEEP